MDLLDSQENVIRGAHRAIAEVLVDRCGKVSRDGVGGALGTEIYMDGRAPRSCNRRRGRLRTRPALGDESWRSC